MNTNDGNRLYELRRTELARPIFGDWQETLIWSCIQNVMGRIYVTDTVNPKSAMALLGDFCFLAGVPAEAFVDAAFACAGREFLIMVPQNDDWGALIERCCGKRAKKVLRYAFRKEPDVFDEKSLETAVAALPKEYRMKRIDEPVFEECLNGSWCRDLVSCYEDYGMYREYGVGVVIQKDGEIVSGASSYSSYIGGIEIEIDTKEEYRRRGLAYAAGAGLILECKRRGLYPSWDAQNLYSAALAEKLGYHRSHTYTAYEVTARDY